MSRKKLEKIFNIALDKVKAKSIIKDNISLKKDMLTIVDEKIDLKKINNLYVFAVGKAAYSMAKECENIIGKRLKGGFAVSTTKSNLAVIEHFTSSHPIVSKKSIKAARKLLQKVKELKKDDYFIFLLSGGASAMIEKPIDGLSLNDFKIVSSSLLTSGIDIKALNTIRKSISQIKGGKLANTIKANGKVLVLSDVIGDDLNIIGSAPMKNKKFKHYLIGNNKIALKEAKRYCKDKFEVSKIITTSLELDSQSACSFINKEIEKYDKKYDTFVLLFGGETTTIVKKDSGYGGRNQELALRLLLKNKPKKNISILCAGSDGIDGRSNAAGAFVDFNIYKEIKKQNLKAKEYLEDSNSNTFFKKLGYDLITGITGTNVMDFIIVVKN